MFTTYIEENFTDTDKQKILNKIWSLDNLNEKLTALKNTTQKVDKS